VTIGLGVSEGAGVEFSTFPLTCVVVIKTPCQRVMQPVTVEMTQDNIIQHYKIPSNAIGITLIVTQ